MGRRTLLRGCAATLCVGAGAALAACGGPRLAAGPQAAETAITLVLQPLIEGGLAAVRAAETELLSGFLHQNPGVKVTMHDPAGSQANLAAIRAGRGPDVFWDFHYAPYLEKAALLRLDEFLTRDNIDPDRWSAAQMGTFRTVGGTFALPCFFGTQVYAVNQGDFDAKHFEYPGPDWTHGEFAAIAHKLAGTDASGHRHYGASLEWYQDQTGDGEIRWLFNAFRGGYIDAAGLALEIFTPNSIAAGQWIYEELLWPQSAQVRHPGATASEFAAGQMSMAAVGNWGLHALVASVKPTLKFDFHPFPIFPAGRTAFGTDDFYAIPATTKYPEQAWALLKWLSAEPDWQRAQIRVQLLSPALNALWPEWVQTVQAATPALKGKAVHYFSDAATKAYALPPQYFAVADTQAQGIIGGYLSRLFARQGHVDLTFKQTQSEVNQLVAAAAAKAAQVSSSATGGGAQQAFAAPSQSGIGHAATAAVAGAVEAGGGGYRLSASGGAVGGTGDTCLYACQPLQEPAATVTCRVAKITGGQAGLMVRGDLSDSAVMLALVAAAGGRVTLQLRPQPRQAATAVAQTAALAPVWLRLQRAGLNWTASTSTDGAKWAQIAPPQPVAVSGCWIGVCATGGGTVSIDNVGGLAATAAYQIG